MIRIRAFEKSDIPQVADLRSKFSTHSREILCSDAQSLLENPLYNKTTPSLVAQDNSEIVGFMGVIPRLMRMNGAPIYAAVMTQFMVHPDYQNKGIGNTLMAEVVHGPQELCFSDRVNEPSQRVHIRLGGKIIPLLSIDWIRVLQPASFAWSKISGDGRLNKCIRPATKLMDIGLSRWMEIDKTIFGRSSLNAITFLNHFEELSANYALSPVYSIEYVQWLLASLKRRKQRGRLRMLAVLSSEDKIIGTYAYYATGKGTAELIYFGANEEFAAPVLNSFFDAASHDGCHAVFGRLNSLLLRPLLHGLCVFRCSEWMVIHSRHAEIRAAIQENNAWISPLDGELAC